MTEDDDELLARAFQDVKPLRGRSLRVAHKATKPVSRPVRFERVETKTPAAQPYMPAGLDHRTQRKLRRGQMRPEARLDLHGHTQAQAFDALARFLAGAQARGHRTVLVVTGKSGVLRHEVPRWLRLAPNAPRVLSSETARPGDGGDGALYVLLRKPKGAAP
jgi:DNA-nicking Smr family endonuclease